VENRFVVRVNNEKMLCFFFQNGNILVREMISGEVSDEKTIVTGVREGYTVNLCKNGEIYVFCQKNSGDIVHLRGKEEWKENIILKSNGNSSENILFYCIENGKGMCLLYNIPAEGKNAYDIMKQTFDGKGQWSAPQKIDTVVGMNEFIFKVNIIDFGHGIVFYQKNRRAGESNIGYREFDIENIGNYNSVYSTNYKIGAVSFLPMSSGLHFIFAVKNIFSSRIIYRKKDSEGMNDYIVLGESQQIDSCELFCVNEKIYAFWKNGMGVFYCVSENNGKSFSKPIKFKGKVAPALKKAVYLSFPKMTSNEFFVSNLYTNNNNICDFQILPEFYSGFVGKRETLKKENQKVESKSNIQEADNMRVKSRDIFDNNIVERLKNQVYMLNNQLAFKDKQIEQLTASIQRKNEEIVMTDRVWREKYRKALGEKDKIKERNNIQKDENIQKNKSIEKSENMQENNNINVLEKDKNN